MIGLAFSCENNRYTVLAAYDPPGNEIDEYRWNVPRPRSDRQFHDPANRQITFKTGDYIHLRKTKLYRFKIK